MSIHVFYIYGIQVSPSFAFLLFLHLEKKSFVMWESSLSINIQFNPKLVYILCTCFVAGEKARIGETTLGKFEGNFQTSTPGGAEVAGGFLQVGHYCLPLSSDAR